MGHGIGPRELYGPPAAEGLSFVEIASAIVRYRRLVLGAGLICAVTLSVILLVLPRKYTSSASFTPQSSRSQLGALGGLAAQFGVAVPGAESNESPAFYADLLKSRTILAPLTDSVVTIHRAGAAMRGDFATFEKVSAPDSAQRIDKAIKALAKDMTVSVVDKTGVVRVSIRTRYAELSHSLVANALNLVNDFNLRVRRSQATAQREFLDRRLADVTRELHASEDSLRAFTEANRGSLLNAPQLQIQQQRLNRSITMHTGVYTGIAQALEQAKLDEIRDTPVITVVEQATLPPLPDRRGLIIKAILAFILGCIVGAVLAVVRQAIENNRRTSPESFMALSGEIAAARSDLRRLVRPLSRERPASRQLE